MSHRVRESVGKAFPDKLILEQTVRKIEINDDNEMSLILIRDLVSQNCTKHIDKMDTLSYARSNKRKRTRN